MQQVSPDRLQAWIEGTANIDLDSPSVDGRSWSNGEDPSPSRRPGRAGEGNSDSCTSGWRGIESTLERNESGDEDLFLTPTSSDASRTPIPDRRTANNSADVALPNSSSGTSGGGGGAGFFSRFLPFRNNSQPAPSQPPVSATPSKTKASVPTLAPERLSCQFENLKRVLKRHGAYALDFRGESHMFKATATGILTNLSHTIELMQQNEEQWRRRFEREVERKRRLEETQRAMAQELAHLRQLTGLEVSANSATSTAGSTHSPHSSAVHTSSLPNGHSRPPVPGRIPSSGSVDLHEPGSYDTRLNNHTGSRSHYGIVGPDLEEGPNSPIREEEFYDAIDAESDRIE
ncbi:unnamed protein product, partial [Echinostoma caproni]|uniref:PH domain-containing protein n=1 Tax=Echinostoma caproni TaxID=27848 RepID=A0A183ARI2_9TREM